MFRGSSVPVHAVQLPGRESRIREPRQRDLGVLTRLLVGELAGLLERPHILFGHSMGALVAYSVAAHRLAAGCRPPEALLVTAFAAPHLRCSVLPADAVDDDELAQRLHEIGGLPALLLQRPEWLGPLMARLRDDLQVCQGRVPAGAAALPCPIFAFGGARDPIVSHEQLAAWRGYTASQFELRMLDGGHFLVQQPGASLLRAIGEVLGAARAPGHERFP